MASYSQSPVKSQFNLNTICDKLKKNLQGDHAWEQFSAQLASKKSNDARVKHVYQHLGRYQLMPKKSYASKCDYFSQQSRDKGNELFANENYEEALNSYRDAIKFATTSKTISIAYANRSAALYRLKKYRESLLDIGRAIEAGYEERLMPKLLLRKKQCEQALELTRAVEAAAEEEKEKLRQELFRPPEKRMAGVSCASASLEISYSESMGRSVMATEDIQPGQVLVIEDPYLSVLKIKYLNSRCNYCCSFNYAMIPCETCTYVMYCNEECRTESWNHGHKFECSIMTRLTSMGLEEIGITLVRILTKARSQHSSWDKLFETVDSVEEQTDPKLKGFTLDINDDLSYKANHYAPIYMLETNIEKWNKDEIFEACIVPSVILYMLKEYTTFFADCPKISGIDLTEENDYFWRAGGLLLRSFLSLRLNSFGIAAYFKNVEHSDTFPVSFAKGVYAFSNLFNHSCSPNSYYIYHGTTLIILASRLIKKGQQAFISYGQNYYETPSFGRRIQLEMDYKFKCECEACVNNWPMLHQLRPANFISEKSKNQFRPVLNESSLKKFLQKNKIDSNFVKKLYKYIAMLEECVPSKELYYYQEFILVNWQLLGNVGLSDDSISVDVVGDNKDDDDDDDNDDEDYTGDNGYNANDALFSLMRIASINKFNPHFPFYPSNF